MLLYRYILVALYEQDSPLGGFGLPLAHAVFAELAERFSNERLVCDKIQVEPTSHESLRVTLRSRWT